MTNLDLYKGREQTLIKHEIFGRYLEKFAFIVGPHWDSITYVDCFSGPWEEKSDDFRDTSFGIAIEHLKKAREAVGQKGKTLKLRCFFVEKSKQNYEKLERHAAQQRAAGLEIVTVNGEFETSIPEIVKFVQAGGANTFPFFFIDPTGWSGFAIDRLKPIYNLPRVEIMINLMTGHVRRFVQTDPSIPALFGFDVRPQLKDLDGLDLEDAATSAYMGELKKRGKFDFVVPAIILKPGEDRTHFHIIYATRHPKGLQVFKEAERGAVGLMNKARATVKLEREEGPQNLLFPALEVAPTTASHTDSLRERYMAQSRARVKAFLENAGEASYDKTWEMAAQGTPLTWESDLKDWIKAWKKSGHLEFLGLAANQRVPQLGMNHKLRCTGTTLP